MKRLMNQFRWVFFVIGCTPAMSQPQILVSAQLSGYGSDYVEQVQSLGTELVFSGVTDSILTINTNPPVSVAADANPDLFYGYIFTTFLSTTCMEATQGYTSDVRRMRVGGSTSPVVIQGGSYFSFIGSGTATATCSGTKCGYLATSGGSCSGWTPYGFSGSGFWELGDFDVDATGDGVFIGGSFQGQTTIGSSMINAGNNTYGVLYNFDLLNTGSTWQSWIEGTGNFFVDKVAYDANNNVLYAIASIDSGATFNVGTNQTMLSTNLPGYSYALLKIDPATGALLDHAVFSCTGLSEIVDMEVSDNGDVFATVNADNGDLYPDQNNPNVMLAGQGSSDWHFLKFDNTLNYNSFFSIATAMPEYGTRFRRANVQLTEVYLATGFGVRNTNLQGNQPDNGVPTIQAILYVFDAGLNVLDSIITGGMGQDVFYDADMDVQGYLYVGGAFTDTTDLDPDPAGTHALVSQGYSDGFIAKYDLTGIVSAGPSIASPATMFAIYPVPGNDAINFVCRLPDGERGKLRIANARGQVVRNVALPYYNGEVITLDDFTAGVYSATLFTDAGRETRKFVVLEHKQ